MDISSYNIGVHAAIYAVFTPFGTPATEDRPFHAMIEYHRNSEINIAVTDMILLLGWLPDVTDEFTYDTAKIEAFKVPAGTVVEMYETTLHYAPCNAADGGFKCVVILPKGTNTPIDFTIAADGEDKLMTAKNKWLIAHEEAAIKGAFNGLRGENISL